MRLARLATVFLSFLVVGTPAAIGAGSGDLWFRYTCSGGAPPQIFIAEAGPLVVEVISNGLGGPGTLDLSLIDRSGATVFSRHLDVPEGLSKETVTTPSLAAGTYDLKPVGSFYAFFRFVTSARYFVWPPCTDFMGESRAGIGAAGSYYFYVPPGTTSFTFRLEVPDNSEQGKAIIVAPDGMLRGSFFVNGKGKRSVTIAVRALDVGFWRVDLTDELSDIRFYLEGVPAYFAESPDAWFHPPEGSEKPKTYLHLTATPETTLAGTEVSLTAEVIPAAATGTVTFTVDGQTAGVVPLTGGKASLPTSFSSSGDHPVSAEYSGDSAWSASQGSGSVFVGAPTFTGLEPVSGTTAGGTRVTLTGTGFKPGCKATFGTAPALQVAVPDTSTLIVTTPAHQAALVDVSVTCPAGSATLPGAFTFVAPTTGAGSGDLWYRYTCTDASAPRIFMSEAGPLTITVRSNGLYAPGSIDLRLIDSGGATVAFEAFGVPEGSSAQTFTVSDLAAGTYVLKPVGSFYAFFRFRTSASHFVWPSCNDFMGESLHGINATGSYYFYVPPGTTSFTFRLEVPDAHEGGTASIFAPAGTLRSWFTVVGKADKPVTIPVAPSDAGFWRVYLTNELSDIRFYLDGVPPYFAESPEAWFHPSTGSGKPATYLTLTALPAPQGPAANAAVQALAQTYKLTAFAVPADATGTVTFRADGQVIGTSPLVAGQASIVTTFDIPGAHVITAEFSGSGLWAASSVNVTVVIPSSHAPATIPLSREAILLLALALALSAAWVLRRQ